MNKQNKLTKETFDPNAITLVNLGLPSGRLWAADNAPGHYTYEEALETFGNYLPKGSAIVELIEECTVSWNDEKKGLDITGPSGNSIFLPAEGYVRPGDIKAVYKNLEGDYWSRMPLSQTGARSLHFHSGHVYPLLSSYRSYGFSVRPCREF